MSTWSETVSPAVLRVPLAPDDLALLRTLHVDDGYALGVRCRQAGLHSDPKGLAVAHRRMLYLEMHGLVRRLDDRKPIVWLRTPEGSEQLRLWEDEPTSVLPLAEGGEAGVVAAGVPVRGEEG